MYLCAYTSIHTHTHKHTHTHTHTHTYMHIHRVSQETVGDAAALQDYRPWALVKMLLSTLQRERVENVSEMAKLEEKIERVHMYMCVCVYSYDIGNRYIYIYIYIYIDSES